MMLNITPRSAYWMLVVSILVASALLATDFKHHGSPDHIHDVVTGSIR